MPVPPSFLYGDVNEEYNQQMGFLPVHQQPQVPQQQQQQQPNYQQPQPQGGVLPAHYNQQSSSGGYAGSLGGNFSASATGEGIRNYLSNSAPTAANPSASLGSIGGASGAPALPQIMSATSSAPSNVGMIPGIGGASGTAIAANGIQAAPASAGLIPGVGTAQVGAQGALAAPNALGPLAQFAPAAGIAAGAYTGYQQLSGIKDAIDGDKLSPMQQAALFLPTFGASVLYNPVKDIFGSHKHKDQVKRDEYVSRWKEVGFLDENNGITLSDGSHFDWNQDDLRANTVDGSMDGDHISDRTPGGKAYNINWEEVKRNPEMRDTIGALNPIMFILSGGEDRWQDNVGKGVNAVHSSGDRQQNVNTFYGKAEEIGLGWGEQKHAIAQAWANDEIDANTRDAWFAAIDKQYGVENPSNARWDQQVTLDEEQQARNLQQLTENPNEPKISFAKPKPIPKPKRE